MIQFIIRLFVFLFFGFVLIINSGNTITKKEEIYPKLIIENFTIVLNADSTIHPEVAVSLRILEKKLREIKSLIGQEKILILQQKPIWVEWEKRKDGAMEYHKSAEWLKNNGYPVEKEKCIEISNVKNFIAWQALNQPFMVLHEMAHAWHDRVLGLDNVKVLNAYEHAVRNNTYFSVDYNLGGKRSAYAITNPEEYFAELTEAYLGENDFFPFNKSQLKQFDSVGYNLMVSIWE